MDINKATNSRVGFFGIGAAGNNVCEVAEFFGYRTCIANTSPEDLESVELVRNKLKIGTNGGCGKERKDGIAEVKKYYREIVAFVEDKFKDNGPEMIYVVFSTGGGTGSGMGPIIVDMLRRMIPTKKFGVIAILPSSDESIVAQVNTLDCLKELYRLNLPTLLVDNSKYKSAEQGVTRKQLFDVINSSIINKFNIVLDENRVSSKYGNIDRKDLMKLLTTPGVTIISNTKPAKEEFENKSFSKIVMDGIDKSIFINIDYDGVVKREGFIFELPPEITSEVDYSEINLELGYPLEVFEGYYNSNEINIISIFAGLSFPEKRIQEIKDIINNSKDYVQTKRENSILSDGEAIDWFAEMRGEDSTPSLDFTKSEDDELDLSDLFGNY